MSADNWTQCPRCTETYHAECKRLYNEIDARYGQVPIEEFDEFRKQVEDFIQKGVDFQFREDYGMGVDEGTFYVEYRGFCRTCGLKFSFNHEEKVTW